MHIKLGKALFLKAIILNLIIIIQISVFITVFGVLTEYKNKINTFCDFSHNYSDDVCFFTPMRIAGSYIINIDYNNIKKSGTAFEFIPKTYDSGNVKVFNYGINTYYGIAKQINKGVFSSGRGENGNIYCITVGDKYGVGDLIEVTIKENYYRFEVTGTMESDAILLNPSKSSASMRTDMLFYEYNADNEGTAVICSADIPDLQTTNGNALVFFSNENQAGKTELKNTGKMISMDQMRKNSQAEYELSAGSYMPFAVFFGVSGILSSAGLVCLNILKNKNTFQVYFMCGMSKRDSVLITFGYLMWVDIGIIIMSFIIHLFTGLTDMISKYYIISPYQIVFTVCSLFIFTLILSVIPLIINKKRSTQ